MVDVLTKTFFLWYFKTFMPSWICTVYIFILLLHLSTASKYFSSLSMTFIIYFLGYRYSKKKLLDKLITTLIRNRVKERIYKNLLRLYNNWLLDVDRLKKLIDTNKPSTYPFKLEQPNNFLTWATAQWFDGNGPFLTLSVNWYNYNLYPKHRKPFHKASVRLIPNGYNQTCPMSGGKVS